MRAFIAWFAAAAVACAATPGAATSAPGLAYGLTDDAWLANGPGAIQDRVAMLNGIGVQVVRFTLHWNEVAPTEPAAPEDSEDPAYDWSSANVVLDALRARGIDVVLQLVGAPSWSNGGRPPNYVPTRAGSFGAFTTAVAQEYPWIRKFEIWNEPNQARWLRPTSARLYVTRLLNPAYTAIHAVTRGARIAGGGTAPRGSTGGVSPIAWVGAMHAARAHLDVYAHNPYPLDPKRESPFHAEPCRSCSTVTMATLGRLERLVGRDFPRARIWLTEYGYQSNPPDRILGVTQALQARYVSEGAYAAYRAPRVDMLIHFLYRDEPSLARFQSGLITLRNAPRPALAAFELPLVEIARSGTTTSLWGQLRAPETTGTDAVLERRVGATWHTFAQITVRARGFFSWRGTLPRRTVVRVRAGNLIGAPLAIT
jgi:hypothetical protein